MTEHYLVPSRRFLSVYFKLFNQLFYGHEILGLENLPESGKGLVINFHGSTINDVLGLFSELCLSRNRHLRIVVDKLWFVVPGLQRALS